MFYEAMQKINSGTYFMDHGVYCFLQIHDDVCSN